LLILYPKIAPEVMSIWAIFIVEVYAYLVVAVMLKKFGPAMPVLSGNPNCRHRSMIGCGYSPFLSH